MTDNDKTLPRREFFKKGGAVLGVAGAAVALSGSAKAAVLDTGNNTSGDYQETEHVKKYYELARF